MSNHGYGEKTPVLGHYLIAMNDTVQTLHASEKNYTGPSSECLLGRGRLLSNMRDTWL